MMSEERRRELKELVSIDLVGEDGNAFSIMGRCTTAMRRAGFSTEERDEYTDAATSGDYNKLLATTMEYVNCDASEDDDEDW